MQDKDKNLANTSQRSSRKHSFLVASIWDLVSVQVFPHEQARPLHLLHYRMLRYLLMTNASHRTQQQFSEHTNTPVNHIRHVVIDLARMGLIESVPFEADRRSKRLDLTPLGREVIENTDPLLKVALALEMALSREDQAAFSSMLLKLHRIWDGLSVKREHFEVLQFLAQAEPADRSIVAAQAHLQIPMTRLRELLRDLYRTGRVAQHRSEADGRAVRLDITPSGAEVLKALSAAGVGSMEEEHASLDQVRKNQQKNPRRQGGKRSGGRGGRQVTIPDSGN